ncbi:MAG: hypothetical protein ABSH37_08795 [Bryobacteraceae bacterium]
MGDPLPNGWPGYVRRQLPAACLRLPRGVVLLPAPAAVDLTPPTAGMTLTPAANSNGWNNTSPVTVKIIASDIGSGVSQILYWVDGGPVNSVAASSATLSVSGGGAHTVGVRVIDNAGNISPQYTQPVKIDLSGTQ